MASEEIRALLVWASQLSGYPVPEGLPEVREVPREQLHARVCPGREECPFYSVYEDGARVIYLVPGLTWKAQDNLMVHELVHYLQDLSGRFGHSCHDLGEREREAYHAQRLYVWQVQNDFGGLPSPLMGCEP